MGKIKTVIVNGIPSDANKEDVAKLFDEDDIFIDMKQNNNKAYVTFRTVEDCKDAVKKYIRQDAESVKVKETLVEIDDVKEADEYEIPAASGFKDPDTDEDDSD